MKNFLQKINRTKKINLFLMILFNILYFYNTRALAQTSVTVRGLRVDPSYFYGQYPGANAAQVAANVVGTAKLYGTNTLFVYAYNSVYGSLYPTAYPGTVVESGYGVLNIFKELTTAAKQNGLKVVAVVPVNNFKSLWINNPSWRAKSKSGADYMPFADTYLLSAWHPDFRVWLKGFYQDLLIKNPDVDGLEAVEPTIDYHWAKESDYNSVATQKFLTLYPNSILGDQNWLDFRAQGLTDLIGLMTSVTGALGKNSYLVQSWPAKPDSTLFSAQVVKDNMGLDFDGILNFSAPNKLTHLMAELIWQQWAAEYGPALFPPSWTRKASLAFINYVGNRAVPLIHAEISPFTGSFTSITPTLTEFADSLSSVKDLGAGIDVYDFSQIYQLNAWAQLKNWGSSAPAPTQISCNSTTRTITSAPNSAGVSRTCIATLPTSLASATAINATVTNGGRYSLVCRSTGNWARYPTTSFCPQ